MNSKAARRSYGRPPLLTTHHTAPPAGYDWLFGSVLSPAR